VACKNLIASLLACTATAVPTPSHAIEPVTVAAVTASNEYLKLDIAFNNIHDINARSSEFAADEENKLLKRYNQQRCPQIKQIKSGVIFEIFDNSQDWICCLKYLFKYFKYFKSYPLCFHANISNVPLNLVPPTYCRP
jgi:hypothetical protein